MTITVAITRSRVYVLPGAKSPWNHVMISRGLRTRVGKRSTKSNGSKMTCMVSSLQGGVGCQRIVLLGVTNRRLFATAGLLVAWERYPGETPLPGPSPRGRGGRQVIAACSSVPLVVQFLCYSLYCLCNFTGTAAFLRMRIFSISTITEKAIAK